MPPVVRDAKSRRLLCGLGHPSLRFVRIERRSRLVQTPPVRRHHTRAHLVRAAVEGVCLQMRIILDRLDEVQPVTTVRATGGVFVRCCGAR
jgi:glycerol kinase